MLSLMLLIVFFGVFFDAAFRCCFACAFSMLILFSFAFLCFCFACPSIFVAHHFAVAVSLPLRCFGSLMHPFNVTLLLCLHRFALALLCFRFTLLCFCFTSPSICMSAPSHLLPCFVFALLWPGLRFALALALLWFASLFLRYAFAFALLRL